MHVEMLIFRTIFLVMMNVLVGARRGFSMYALSFIDFIDKLYSHLLISRRVESMFDVKKFFAKKKL